MKLARTILLSLLGFLLLIFIVALFFPKTYSVQRSIVIKQPAEKLYKEISDYNDFKDWNPWSESDPTTKKIVEGQPSKSGHKYSWEGEKTGKGYMIITETKRPTMIHSKLSTLTPMESESEVYFTIEPVEGGTKVTWKNEGNLDYPIGRYLGFMVKDMLEKDFDKGLENLKQYAEKH
ncbi:MAG: SRPBCC family protein [Sporocytophaga sp.]|nr:SRPBCC family protein [Sporocytophaga sp.]